MMIKSLYICDYVKDPEIGRLSQIMCMSPEYTQRYPCRRVRERLDKDKKEGHMTTESEVGVM